MIVEKQSSSNEKETNTPEVFQDPTQHEYSPLINERKTKRQKIETKDAFTGSFGLAWHAHT
jgi:hypothetical protein